jgi:hypothetical protein
MIHVMTYEGSKIDSYRGHGANVTCLRLDEDNEFLASAGYDGKHCSLQPSSLPTPCGPRILCPASMDPTLVSVKRNTNAQVG